MNCYMELLYEIVILIRFQCDLHYACYRFISILFRLANVMDETVLSELADAMAGAYVSTKEDAYERRRRRDDHDLQVFVDGIEPELRRAVLNAITELLGTLHAPVGDVCKVCLERPRDCVILPCWHFGICRECALIITRDDRPKCPICRSLMTSVMKMYPV